MPSKSKISIIIPVYNEQKSISDCIDNVKQSCGHDSEIIVVDGSPSKSTLSLIKDSDILKLHSSPGRALQMNNGANAASGDILIFLHADTIIPEKSGDLVRQALEIPTATAGAFKLSFNDTSWTMQIIAFIANLRTRLERVPYGDQGLFIKRATFQKLGGFPIIPIMEDVEFFRNLKKQKLEILILDENIITSARRYKVSGPLKCATRNCMLRLLHLCGVSPNSLTKMYRLKGA